MQIKTQQVIQEWNDPRLKEANIIYDGCGFNTDTAL